MAIEDILRENVGGFDIETDEYWTPHPRVYMVCLATSKGDYVLDTFHKVDTEKIESALDITRAAKRLTYKTEPELRYETSKLMRELGLNVWGGQFVKHFDLPQLLKAKDRLFLPAADNSEPISKGVHDPFPDFGINGSIVVDTWDFSRNFFSMFLADNKLETIASFCSKFYDCIHRYIKAESYEDQRALVKQAKLGDESAAWRLGQYCYDDTIMHHELTELFLGYLTKFADISKTFVNHINDCGRKKIATCFWDNQHMQRTNVLRSGFEKARYDNFDTNNQRGSKKFTWYMDKLMQEKIEFELRKGVFNDARVLYLPFSKGLADFFRENKDTARLLDLTESEKNPVSKIIYMQMIDAFSIEPLRDLVEIDNDQSFEYKFDKKYRKFGAKAENLKKCFHSALDELAAAIDRQKLINISKNLVFLEDLSESEIQRLLSLGYVSLGKCDAISVSKGQVIYKIGDEVLCTGITVPSKKKRITLDYEHGQMTNIETRVLRDVVETLFNDIEAAENIALQELRDIQQGDVAVTDYISAVNVYEEGKNVSYRANTRRSAEAIRKLDARKGQVLLYLMIDDAKIKYLGYDPGEEKFYYIKRSSAGGKRSTERAYLTFDEKSQKFGNDMKINKNEYADMIFGKHSKLQRILDACKD
jgi:hypothetical protein